MTSSPDDPVISTESRRALVVVAAGSGTRLGFGIPKAAVPLHGSTILERALQALTPDLGLDLIVLVLPEAAEAQRHLLPAAGPLAARTGAEVVVVDGGETRAASAAAGTGVITEHAQRHSWNPSQVQVLIHDAARPLTPTGVFDRVLREMDSGAEAAVPAVESTDTIKRVDQSGRVQATLPRTQLRKIQTPQGFTLALLQRGEQYLLQHPTKAESLTDEAMIAEHLHVAVTTVPGDQRALKITTPTDLLTAEALMTKTPAAQPPVPRVGIGQDVHAFAPPNDPTPLWLAGLHWPEQQGLAGHSDGDAVAHACCDALFSAAGLGDLGVHFGTERPELAGALGATLLGEAAAIVRRAGFEISSIAVQFIGSRPKFGPRREEAQQVLSQAAGAPVAVSATTSDGLGFTGRGEGISATATAVLTPTR